MKIYIATFLVCFVAVLVLAQAPPGSSISFVTSGTCDPPAPGRSILCGGATDVQLSLNGAAYKTVQGAAGAQGANGAPGPQGAIGAQGPVGPQGPAGNAWTQCTGVTFVVTSPLATLSGGTATLTGTLNVVPVNCH